ncbi:MAG: diguanylate cyclase [Myxococcales bacterium]|nr:diguanylate cyclase [Myxococcales bacterium]
MASPPLSLPSRVQRQQAALLAIGAGWRHYESDLDGALRAITETAVAAMDVDRASVWLFDEARTKIVCEDLFERTPGRHSRGIELEATQYPRYFEAVGSEEVIAASDAHGDRRTSEFSQGYLTPLGIGAMLDAPIRSGGRVVGVLCHEHVGAEREFFIDEQNTANYLASLVSLSLELRRRLQSEQQLAESLSLLRAAFDATGEGILAVDRSGHAIAHNQRFVEIWEVPKELLGPAGDGGARLVYLAEQTLHPDAFVARAREVFADPEEETTDLIELRDGRSIERTSRPQWLAGEVIGRVWSYRDVTHSRRVEAALRASEERLRELAIRDALTGLYNRRHLHERISEEIARAARSGRAFTLAMLDIDHFKRVNDEHGHQTGDDVLRALAEDLSARVRKTDCAGRWGGEEFLLILPETPRSAALKLLDELREHVGRARDGLPRFTVSVGVAEHPADATELLPLVASADTRLYEAKRAGRNCVR